MGIITGIRPQKRDPTRVNIYLDGEFAFGLPAVVATSLHVGQALTEVDITRLERAGLYEKVRLLAVRYISYRPRSTAEVRRHFIGKGYDEELVSAVISRLAETALLDDLAFANYWIEQRETFKPRSQFYLRQELRQKGVAEDIIEGALVIVDDETSARQAAVAQLRRWQGVPADVRRAKLGRHLQRRGFSYGVIRALLDELITEDDDISEDIY